MFGLNAILYSDDEIERRMGTTSSSSPNSTTESSIAQDLPKSSLSFVITLGMNLLLGLIILIPKAYECDIMRAFKTKNILIIPFV